MNKENPYIINGSYDDGVVCFGPLTESELERHAKLTRHTVVPSDVHLSQSFLITNEDENNVNISMSTNNLEEEKETSSINAKQSSSNDSPSVFSSPCVTEFLKSENLIATEVINRYIRMGSTSPNETICSDLDPEDKNKSVFNDNEMSSCDQLSVSNIFEQNININQENISDVATNICTLKYCSQQDKDATIYSDSDLEDDCEGSIVTEEYSVTPGKQRLFDLRLAKLSRAKSFIVPALVMDRIEETATPILPKDQDSSLNLNHKVSYGTSEVEGNMLVLENTDNLNHSSSTVEFNQTVDSRDLESTKYIDDNDKPIDLMVSAINLDLPLKIVNETLSISNATENHLYVENSMNVMSITTVSATDVNDYNEEKSLTMEVDNISSNMCVVEDLSDDNKTCTDKFSRNDRSMDFSVSLNKTNNDILNAAEHNFDIERSINITSNTTYPIIDVNNYNNEKKSMNMKTENEQTITSFMEDISYETYTNNLSTDRLNVNLNGSLNKTNQSGNISNVIKHKFDMERSINITASTTAPVIDVNDYNNEEKSVRMEMEIKQTNTSVMVDVSDETYINNISADSLNVNLNESLNETNQSGNISNVIDHKFDMERSINIMSCTTAPVIDVNNYNNEEKSVRIEVETKLTNTNVVEDVSDETYINNISADSLNVNLNESLNKTNQSGNISNVTEHKFDMERSINITSCTTAPVIDVNNYNYEEKSVRIEVETKQTNTNVVKNVSDETFNNNISTDNLSVKLNESLNTNNQSGNILNMTEHRFVLENSLNNMPNLTVLPLFSNDTLQSNGIENEGSKSSANMDISNSEKIVSETCYTTLGDHQSPSCDNTELNTSNHNLKERNDSLLNNLTAVSNLSIIIENRTLEENESDQDFGNSIISTTSVTKNIIYESQDNEMFNKSTNENERKLSNVTKDNSNSDVVEHSTTDEVDNKIGEMEIKLNEVTLINNNIVDSTLLLAENNDTIKNLTSDEKMNEIQHIESCSMLPDKISNISIKMENYQLGIKTPDQPLISENAKEIHLSQHILDKNDSTKIHRFSANKYILESKNPYENSIDDKQHDVLPTNNIQQHDLLETLNNSINEYNQLEQMCNIEEDKKVQMFIYETPKTEKLLDLTILEQKPTFECQIKNQKLLNFSIVDQTPITKNVKQNDTSIDLNSVDQMWDLEEVLTDKINFKENGLFLNNVSAISSLDIDLLADESINTCLSNHSNSICNETITETNFNLSTNREINMLNTTNKDKNTIEKIHDVGLLDSCSTVLVNKQIEMKKSSNSLNKTIDQIEYLSNITESEQNNCGEHKNYFVQTGRIESGPKCLLNNMNLNECAIMDFSIIEQPLLQTSELKNYADITSAESDCNVSNLIEMSVVSTANINSNEQVVVSPENPVVIMTSENQSEKSINNSSDTNNTAIFYKESTSLNETKFLTDMQLNDESLLMESPDKSSIAESFHSIESEHVQEDNKRKIEAIQEYQSKEKKIKVMNEEPRTPMSMLYKIRSMFQSSEKRPLHSTNENYLKLNKSHQTLNLCKYEENKDNFTKPISLKKSEISVKSKIPCKVNDRSMLKNDELNNSSSLNNSIKTIPKRVPFVLSDVSNSSNKKCPESRIPSKFQK